MERSYTKALLGEDKWLTVVVERRVKQAVSETGANARRQRLPWLSNVSGNELGALHCMNMYSVDTKKEEEIEKRSTY